MKLAIVLTGNEIARQVEQLSGFLTSEFSNGNEIEAWVLLDREFDLSSVCISSLVGRVKSIQVKNAFVAESCLDAIAEMVQLNQPQLILFSGDSFAAGLPARVAHRFNGSSCTDVRAAQQVDGRFVIEKRVYSNNLVARFVLKRMPYCISIARDFTYRQDVAISCPQLEDVVLSCSSHTDWIRSHKVDFAVAEEALSSAKIVIAIGKGIGGKEKVALLGELANLLGGKLGASRPVVMNAWLGMEHLIGASGAMAAPDLCIAIGISGAAAFAVGIEKSKFIVAINKDEKAPIFKIADVGLCADYREIVLELKKVLSNSNNSEIG